MRARTSFSAAGRSRFSLPGLSGMALGADPRTASLSRAVEGKNWECANGAIRKRRGWAQCAPRLSARADGVFSVPYDGGETLLAYAGGAFYVLVGNEWKSVPVRKTVSDMAGNLRQNRIRGVYAGDCLYFVGTGALLRYGLFDGAWEVRTVEPYVPTTTVGIAPTTAGDGERRAYEDANLLTPRRKNTLFGGAAGSTWALDGAVSNEEAIDVEVTASVDGSLTVLHFYNKPAEGGKTLYADGDVVAGSLDLGTGILRMAAATTPPGSAPNITVTFTAASGIFGSVSRAGRRAIYECSFGTLFGVGGAQDRLFLSGNPAHPNLVFFSERGDFSYFPDRCVGAFGTDATAVVGLLPLSDDVMAVFKERGRGGEATVYYQSGEYRSFYDEDGNLLRTVPVFSIRAGAMGEAPTNPFAVGSLAGDSLLVSHGGVFGIESLENVTVDARRLCERSRSISRRLRESDLSDAVVGVHGTRLYLAVGDGCFVTDANTRHRDGETGESTYEWYYWEPMRVHLFFEWEGKACFADREGRLLALDAADADEIYEQSASGELGFDYERGRLLFSPRLFSYVSGNYAEVTLLTDGIFAPFLEGAAEISGNRIHVGEDFSEYLWEDTELYPSQSGTVVQSGYPYYVVEPDPANGTFSLSATRGGRAISLSGITETLCLYRKLSGRRLTVRVIDSLSCAASLSLGRDMPALRQINYFAPRAEGAAGEVLVPTNPLCRVHVSEPVVAEWVTPVFEVGDPTLKKTVLSLAVRAMGEVRVTLETAREAVVREVRHGGGCAFDNVDFSRFSFVGDFSESETFPLHLFGSGGLRLRFLSEDRYPAAVFGADLLYRQTNFKKGVT